MNNAYNASYGKMNLKKICSHFSRKWTANKYFFASDEPEEERKEEKSEKERLRS